MTIILKQTDSEKTFKTFGLDKQDILEKVWQRINPIFEKYVDKAMQRGYKRNDFMYPLRDYLNYSDVVEYVAFDFAQEVHKAMYDLPVYVQGPRMYPLDDDDENLWHWTISFDGRELELGIRNPENFINK